MRIAPTPNIHQRARCLRNPFFTIGIALALPAFAAAATPLFSFVGSNVNSDGRQWPHASSAANGVLTLTYTGPSVQAGNIEVSGVATNVWGGTFGGSQNFSGEMRLLIRNVSKGTSYDSSNFFNNFHLPWTTASVTSKRFNAASLGTLDPGDQLQCRFYETHDSSTLDSRWNSVTVSVYRKPPPTSGHTAIDILPCPCPPIEVVTLEFETAIALFDAEGGVVEMSGTPAVITLEDLPPGEYYLAVVAQGGGFDEGFHAMPGGGLGVDSIVQIHREEELLFEGWMHDDDVLWHRLEYAEPECAADLDGDGVVSLSDLAALLSVYGSTCP